AWVKAKGTIGEWMNAKWSNGYPDWSDGASFVCLLPKYGVDFTKLKSNGTDNTGYLTPIYKKNRSKMYDVIEARAKKAQDGGCTAVVKYTISASSGANGSITPNGDVKVTKGDNKTFTISPKAGYEVKDVKVDGSSVGAKTSYTFKNVTGDHTIHASFALVAVETYTITASAGANGSITPSGAVSVNKGANQKFTISAASGYKVKEVLVDNASVGAVSTYTFSNVVKDHSIEATFEKTAASPIVVTDIVTDCNAAKKARNIIFFTVSAAHNKVTSSRGAVVNDGNGKYRVREVGVKFGSVLNYKITVSQGKKVVATKTVKVTAASSCNPTTKQFTITATAGANGTITPSGAVKVNEGADKTFTIKAASGYKIKNVVVNNSSVGAVATYTFSKVAKDQSIKATFASDGPAKDCAGVPGGSAYIDDCGDCVGGTTGKEPCTQGGFDFIDYSTYSVGMSYDGNHHDKDDILAAPFAIAILGQVGLTGKVTHIDYNNHLGTNTPSQAKDMVTSINGACDKWGLTKSVAFDCMKNLNGAVNSIKKSVNGATANNRFFYACGGPMEVPWRGINASNQANRKNTTAISHSGWNNNHSDTPQLKHKWSDIKKTGVKTIDIKDQNQTALKVAKGQWAWLKNKGGKFAWLYSRDVKNEKKDA
ncbi:MAG: hypothetical protein MI922_09300, partial [Bacteroidales bacterium]|nr:hypothetical protein [Bacteroidales bacterium]